ncbi:MAG: M48 family metallopeptidase [Muribaculaceae bacterium]|nr:M48 family metallopeptidase [Muribaculaceae bacterium]
MKKRMIAGAFVLALVGAAVPATMAKINVNVAKAASSIGKVAQAVTLTDAQMAAYAKESVDWMDTHNKVSDADSEYTKRLNRLTEGLTEADGMPLNFKVYEVIDVNAFACPDGSVRVFSSLMDIMSDDELLGVIGHEIGHVAKHHSKKAFKEDLMADALKDGMAAAGGVAAALSESQLASLGKSLAGAKYSQKQENEADDFGYEFLKSHGKNPWGMVMAFEKLDSMSGSSKSSMVDRMFSSHPQTADRIARMTKRAQKDGIARPE